MRSKNSSTGSVSLCAMLAASLGSLSAPAVIGSTHAISTAANASQADDITRLKAQALRAMSQRINLDVEDQPLEDIMNYFIDVTGVALDPIYLDSLGTSGMDPNGLISLRVTNVPALTALERVLKQAERVDNLGDEYTWQLTEIGTLQCGPKLELNNEQRVELYDVSDLILEIQDFDEIPDFNLSGSGGGGGGGGSPFGGGSNTDVELTPQGQRVQNLVDLIQGTIEPAQWAVAGGSGAQLSIYGTSLIVNAPDYIHRQLAGYDFWPARLQRPTGRVGVQVRPDPRYAQPREP